MSLRMLASLLLLSLLTPAVLGAPVLYRLLDAVSANDTVTFAGSFGAPGAVTSVSFCDGSGRCISSPVSVPSSTTVRATVAALDPASTLNATLLGPSGK